MATWLPKNDHRVDAADTAIKVMRARILDRISRGPYLNINHSSTSRSHIRLVDTSLEDAYEVLSRGSNVDILPLEEVSTQSDDEDTIEFATLFSAALNTNDEYLGTIDQIDEESQSYERDMENAERVLRDYIRSELKMPPRLSSADISPADIARAQGIDPSYRLPVATQRDAETTPARELQTLQLNASMGPRVNSMRLSANSAAEETGSPALYAIFGFLEWSDSTASSRDRLTPLVMLPLQFDNDVYQKTKRFSISAYEAEVFVNPVLQTRLADYERVVIPDFVDDGDTPDPIGRYLKIVEEIIEPKPNWKVRPFLTFALFNSVDIVVWRNLDSQHWPDGTSPAQHSVVARLLGGTDDRPQTKKEYEIDSVEVTEELPATILPADSSQYAAILDALHGESMVIQGPPGTGKSQTIANIIAASIFDGKKVLFLADKMAALDVVKDRLQDVGLGEFVLEMHSTNATKSRLYQSFKTPDSKTNVRPESSKAYRERINDQLERKRALNEYATILNSEVGSTGQTLNNAIWKRNLLRSDGLPQVLSGISLDHSSDVTEAHFQSILTDLANYQQTRAEAVNDFNLDAKHPWSWVKATELTPIDEEVLVRLLSEYKTHLETIISAWDDTGISLRPNSADLSLGDITDHISNGLTAIQSMDPHAAPTFFSSLHPRPQYDAVVALVTAHEKLNALENQTAVEFAQLPQSQTFATLLDCLSNTDIETVGQVGVVKLRTEELVRQNVTFQENYVTLCEWIGIEPVDPVSNAQLLMQALAVISNTSDNGLKYREAMAHSEASEQQIGLLRDKQVRYEDLQSNLSSDASLTLVGYPTGLEAHASIIARYGNSFFGRLRSSYKTSKNVWRNLFPYSGDVDNDHMTSDLLALATMITILQEIDSDPEIKYLCGPHFTGITTDFSGLIEAVRLIESVRLIVNRDPDTSRYIQDWIKQSSTRSLRDFVNYAENILAIDFSIIDDISTDISFDTYIETLQSQCESLNNGLNIILSNPGIKQNWVLSDVEDMARAVEDHEIFTQTLNSNTVALEILKRHDLNLDSDMSEIRLGCQSYATFVQNTVELWPGAADGLIEVANSDLIGETEEHFRKLEVSIQACDSLQKQISDLADGFIDNSGTDFGLLLSDQLTHAVKALSSPSALTRWNRLQTAKHAAITMYTDRVIDLFETNQLDVNLPRAWEQIYWSSVVNESYRDNLLLGRASGPSLEIARERLKEIDDVIEKQTRIQVASTAESMKRRSPMGIGSGRVGRWTETNLINRLKEQERPRVKIRDFMDRAGTAALRHKPCTMMSPYSASMYLKKGDIQFDIVIIDEASQVRPEEAIGAIAHSHQAVIVGDEQQLPPTSFFNRNSGSYEDEDELGTETSILELAIASLGSGRELRWHYRSKHQSLIAFSNLYFYDEELIVFPSPTDKASNDLGVHYTYLEEGEYVSSGAGRRRAGSNSVEAKYVAEMAVQAMVDNPDRTLGVATMNRAQADLIDDEVSLAIASSPQARRYMATHAGTLGRFFVKNLENVQGDERDHIIISTVYGRRPGTDTVLQNFGPISGPYGHRRLNVIYTRAKYKVDLVTSLTANDIKAQTGANRGVGALKGYLQYAATGLLASNRTANRQTPENEFEESIGRRLLTSGFEVDYQVGVGRYRIDIGVKHPEYPFGYLAGIEADGAMYHSAQSARDRDVLRQEVLESMGWNIYRIWSTDWFRDADSETDKMVDHLTTRLENMRSLAKPLQPAVDFEEDLWSDEEPDLTHDEPVSPETIQAQATITEKFVDVDDEEEDVTPLKSLYEAVSDPPTVRPTLIFKCSVCESETYKTMLMIRRHIKLEHKGAARIVSADIPDATPTPVQNVTASTTPPTRRNDQSDPRSLVCPICGRKCRTKNGYNQHIQRAHRGRS